MARLEGIIPKTLQEFLKSGDSSDPKLKDFWEKWIYVKDRGEFFRPSGYLAKTPDSTGSQESEDGRQEAGGRGERSPSPRNTGEGIGNKQLSEIIGVPLSTIEKWKGAMKRGESIEFRRYPNFPREWTLGTDGRWYRRESSDG